MKKTIILFSTITLLTLASFAQNKKPATGNGLSFGVNAGFTFPRMATYDKNTDITTITGLNTSFYLGGTIEMPISQLFSVQSGLSLINKGSKFNYLINGSSYSYKTRLLYLEIPVNLIASFEIGSGKFLVGVGPYLGFALRGTTKTPTQDLFTGQVTTVSNDVVFGSGKGQIRSVDFGLGSLMGYQFKNGIGIQIGSSMGLTDIGNDSGSSTRNVLSTIGLSYNFKK